MATSPLIDASGRCALTQGQIDAFKSQAEALHTKLLGEVTDAFDNLSETPSKAQETALLDNMNKLLKMAPAVDAAVILGHVCNRVNRGLRLPNVKLPGIGG